MGGLLRQLTEGLAAAPVDTARAPHFRNSDGGGPVPPAIIDASVATGPAATGPALAQADRILGAAGYPVIVSWKLSLEHQSVVVAEGQVAGIGRRPGPDISLVVPEPTVSRVHCRISVRQGRAVVEDRGSSNGTRIRRGGSIYTVDGSMELEPGDELLVLDKVTLARVERDAG